MVRKKSKGKWLILKHLNLNYTKKYFSEMQWTSSIASLWLKKENFQNTALLPQTWDMGWLNLMDPAQEAAYFYMTAGTEATSANSSLFDHNEMMEKCPLYMPI